MTPETSPTLKKSLDKHLPCQQTPKCLSAYIEFTEDLILKNMDTFTTQL